MIRILYTSGIQMVESYPAVEWPGIPMVSLTHVTFGHHFPKNHLKPNLFSLVLNGPMLQKQEPNILIKVCV